ncbi:MAG TPA: methylated-DNA--[protein]-cysteine S-methyltransferase [Micropepsaceae bacterium]|nr:methylated-DNA--[protein]-cysteine S-methyltransferase [Micropepsaceae bacterium]
MLHRLEQQQGEKSAIHSRIARSIRYLAENYEAQPSLEEAADVAGLSPYHFQREFSRLAGVSPKSFIGHLTLEHAKARLKKGASVLDAALDAGLSGSSRLHDLCLKVECMTPGDYTKGGAGLRIRYGFHATLFGSALLMATERGLCGLAFADEGGEDGELADMRSRWPKAELVHDQSAIAPYASRIFSANGKRNDLPIQLFGTPWQIKVWQALLAIPEGEVVSYRTIAETVCTRRASRAAGAAIGRNPISLLIPCHRVLASSGALTGYHWGESRKRALLALEAARASA